MRFVLSILFFAVMTSQASNAGLELQTGHGFIKFMGDEGRGEGKHVVLIAGDEESRSEEAMPMLARVLAENHGFEATVLFSADADGTINPSTTDNLSGCEALDTADVLILCIRFREWNDETMSKLEAAINRGVPIIGLRTSTHAFHFSKKSRWAEWSWNDDSGGFGRKILGETWISHWGKPKSQATRGKIELVNQHHALLNGIENVFVPSNVYEVYPPSDATILLRGHVLSGNSKDSGPSDRWKKVTASKDKQEVNHPAMPIAWTRQVSNPAGTTNKVLTCTAGVAKDLKNNDLRRMIINGVFWGLNMEVPARADVSICGSYQPTDSGFNCFQKNRKAIDFAKD